MGHRREKLSSVSKQPARREGPVRGLPAVPEEQQGRSPLLATVQRSRTICTKFLVETGQIRDAHTTQQHIAIRHGEPPAHPGPDFSRVRGSWRGPHAPVPAAGLTCVDGTRVVVGVGTPLLAAAHRGSRLLAARALLYTQPGIWSGQGERQRDRETSSEPSAKVRSPEGTGVPAAAPSCPLAASSLRHPFTAARPTPSAAATPFLGGKY